MGKGSRPRPATLPGDLVDSLRVKSLPKRCTARVGEDSWDMTLTVRACEGPVHLVAQRIPSDRTLGRCAWCGQRYHAKSHAE